MLYPWSILGVPIPEANATIEALGKISATCNGAQNVLFQGNHCINLKATNLGRKNLPLPGLSASGAWPSASPGRSGASSLPGPSVHVLDLPL